jgi:phospholipase C
VLPYFPPFRDPLSPLFKGAFTPTFPNDFVSDIAAGTLPSVSWLVPPLGFDEHPSSAPANGMWFTSLVLDALVSNPEVWAKTALFLMYDENDGWFDHVAPPTAPPGTPGEYLTATPPTAGDPDLGGFEGPLGLGVRVPCLVISPFSRGGHIVSETFDHTSQLQLIAARFGVEVPNVSTWRRQTVGDLTSTLTGAPKHGGMPKLPATAPFMPLTGACAATSQDTESGGAGPSVPTKQRMPRQGASSVPASHFFPPTAEQAAVSDDDRTRLDLQPAGSTATTKSGYNRLTHV